MRARVLRGASWILWVLIASASLACSPPRVLVLGIDGATWTVMDPLIAAGYLPNLGRIVEGGATFALDCVPASSFNPCFCPPVWTTIATGRTAADHQITNFDTPSSARRVKALWNVLYAYGGTSTLLAYRGTWPTEVSGGTVLTEPGAIAAGRELFDSVESSEHPGLSDPASLAQPSDLLEQLGVMPSLVPPEERRPAWGPFAMDRVSMDVLLRLAVRRRDEPPAARGAELTMALLHSPDKSEHMTWSQIQQEQWGPIDVDRLLESADAWDGPVWKAGPFAWSNVPDQYLEIDAWLGRLLAATSYDFIVLVSDHGMTRGTPSGFPGEHNTDRIEAHVGILAIYGGGVVATPVRGAATVLDVAPTVAYLLRLPVARNLPGRVLTEIFSPDRLRAFPLATVASWD